MEPQYRFCTSADGTRIAYAVYGSGPPLLYAGQIALGLDAQFSLLESRAFMDALALRTTLVTFDRRGTGVSARDVDDLSVEAQARDIAAVVEAASIGSFTLFVNGSTALSVCARYAADHQERVERVVLWAAASGGDDEERVRAIREDWSYYRRVWAGTMYPDGPVSLQRAFSKVMKETLSAEMMARHIEAPAEVNIDELLTAVTAPALVLQREQLTTMRQATMRVAGLLPNSQLRIVAGSTAASPFPGHEPVVAAVFEFMGLTEPAAGRAGVTTILFTDIVGHTEMMQRLGDAKGRDVLREHERITRETLKQHGGAEVKTMGDGFLASFGSVARAMECAIALQRAFAEHSEKEGEPLHVRVGLNAGEPIEEDGDLFGATVILASRIAAKADGGEILIPEPVRHLLSGKTFTFSDRGEFAMKGFDDAVRLYEVRWGKDA